MANKGEIGSQAVQSGILTSTSLLCSLLLSITPYCVSLLSTAPQYSIYYYSTISHSPRIRFARARALAAMPPSNVQTMDRNFHVGEDYQVCETVGEGAYGVVWSVTP